MMKISVALKRSVLSEQKRESLIYFNIAVETKPIWFTHSRIVIVIIQKEIECERENMMQQKSELDVFTKQWQTWTSEEQRKKTEREGRKREMLMVHT